MELITSSWEETKRLGEKIAQFLQPGDIICLNGDLGAGKTCLTQGIGLGLGIKKHLTSPTFNLVKEYQGNHPLYHFDLYRINEEDMEEIGYEDYFYGDGITVIEWPEKAGSFLPKKRMDIIIKKIDKKKRLLQFQAFGERAKDLLKVVQDNVNFGH